MDIDFTGISGYNTLINTGRCSVDEIFDLLIIGSGPAGVSAALTARHRGKSALIITTSPEDSPLYRAEHVDNYPGLPAATGAELVQSFVDHAEKSGVKFARGRALAVADLGGTFGVSVGADFVQGRSLVLACGLTRAKPYPGEAEFLGRGVSYCATCDGMLYRGRPVAVIGLSADAPEEAEYLRGIGCQVEYFDLSRAKRYEIRGDERVTTLTADGTDYAADCVFILRSGLAPDSLLPGLALENGHIKVDAVMATSVPGVFAAGDCTGAPYQVAKAAGEGNIAGLSACKYVEQKTKEDK